MLVNSGYGCVCAWWDGRLVCSMRDDYKLIIQRMLMTLCFLFLQCFSSCHYADTEDKEEDKQKEKEKQNNNNNNDEAQR